MYRKALSDALTRAHSTPLARGGSGGIQTPQNHQPTALRAPPEAHHPANIEKPMTHSDGH